MLNIMALVAFQSNMQKLPTQTDIYKPIAREATETKRLASYPYPRMKSKNINHSVKLHAFIIYTGHRKHLALIWSSFCSYFIKFLHIIIIF